MAVQLEFALMSYTCVKFEFLLHAKYNYKNKAITTTKESTSLF